MSVRAQSCFTAASLIYWSYSSVMVKSSAPSRQVRSRDPFLRLLRIFALNLDRHFAALADFSIIATSAEYGRLEKVSISSGVRRNTN